VEIAIIKLKSYKSPVLIRFRPNSSKQGVKLERSEIHRHICCIWNKEELPQQWKESIIVPIYKKGVKTDCNDYRGISLV
jgi:hypothetical protein